MKSHYDLALSNLFSQTDCSAFLAEYSSGKRKLVIGFSDLEDLDYQGEEEIVLLLHEQHEISENDRKNIDVLVEKGLKVRVQKAKVVQVKNDDQAAEFLGLDFNCVVFGVCANVVSAKVFDNVNSFHDSVFLVRPR